MEHIMIKDALNDIFTELDGMRYNSSAWERVNRCQAYYQSVTLNNGEAIIVLKSYSTIVAFYHQVDREHAIVYERDYYSNTTCQHVRKFAQKMRETYARQLHGDDYWNFAYRVRVDRLK